MAVTAKSHRRHRELMNYSVLEAGASLKGIVPECLSLGGESQQSATQSVR